MSKKTVKELLGAARKQLDRLEKGVAEANGDAGGLELAQVVVGLHKAQVAIGRLADKLPGSGKK